MTFPFFGVFRQEFMKFWESVEDTSLFPSRSRDSFRRYSPLSFEVVEKAKPKANANYVARSKAVLKLTCNAGANRVAACALASTWRLSRTNL